MIDNVSSSLASWNYPNPIKYGRTASTLAEDFFLDVMMDEDIGMKTRLDAAQTHSLLKSSWTEGYLWANRVDKVYTEGIKKYHKIKFSGKDYDYLHDE